MKTMLITLLTAAAALAGGTIENAIAQEPIRITVARPERVPGGGMLVNGVFFNFYKDETENIQGHLRRHKDCRPLRVRVTLDITTADYVLTHRYDPNALRHHAVVLYDANGDWVTDTRTMGLKNAVKDICKDLRDIL